MVSDDLSDLLDRTALIKALAEQGFAGAQKILKDAAGKDPTLAAAWPSSGNAFVARPPGRSAV